MGPEGAIDDGLLVERPLDESVLGIGCVLTVLQAIVDSLSDTLSGTAGCAWARVSNAQSPEMTANAKRARMREEAGIAICVAFQ